VVAVGTGNKAALDTLLSLIPFLAWIAFIFVAVYLVKSIIKEVHYTQLSNTGIFDIDKMTGPEFEDRLMVLYRHLGYKVQHTGKSGDAGVDLIAEKDGKKIAIQAKRYEGNVGESAVQQVHTGKHFYHCDEAIIVTNSNFTKMAWRVARETGIKLWSRNYLIKVLETEHEQVDQSPSNAPLSSIVNWLITIFPNKQKVKIAEIQPQQNSEVTQKTPIQTQTNTELFNYISNCLTAGEQWADLKMRLLQVGWKEDNLNDVFFQIYNPDEIK